MPDLGCGGASDHAVLLRCPKDPSDVERGFVMFSLYFSIFSSAGILRGHSRPMSFATHSYIIFIDVITLHLCAIEKEEEPYD